MLALIHLVEKLVGWLLWRLVLQRELDSFSGTRCRCVCGAVRIFHVGKEALTFSHPRIPTSLHPFFPTSQHPCICISQHPFFPISQHPYIPVSPQSLCPEHGRSSLSDATPLCKEGLALIAQQQRLPSASGLGALIPSFLPIEFNCDNSKCCFFVTSFFFFPKGFKVATQLTDRLSGIKLSGVFCFLSLFFGEGAGEQITYSLNKINLKRQMRICELMLRFYFESREE